MDRCSPSCRQRDAVVQFLSVIFCERRKKEMNQKELNEIRRRFRLDKNNFSRIFGCYVNSNREVISWIDASLGLMRQEEQEMYLGL
ncbi:MAG: DUF4317 family protein, partial [Oscillospiraceae bacterium]|nr:DUF4317 family protein [Oscillospiraceae bacterium]